MQKERPYKRETTVYNIWLNFNLNIESAKKKNCFKNIFSALFFLLAKFYSNNNYYENQY